MGGKASDTVTIENQENKRGPWFRDGFSETQTAARETTKREFDPGSSFQGQGDPRGPELVRDKTKRGFVPGPKEARTTLVEKDGFPPEGSPMGSRPNEISAFL